MPIINPTLPADGDEAIVSPYNTAITAILGVLNGSVDSDNLADNAAITSKIADSAVTNGKVADHTLDLGAKAATWDWWITANESWSYASASTITVPSDATAKYDVGDIIKITQSATVKYFVITAVAATLLTVSGLAAVTVANSAITANYYSKSNKARGLGLKGAAPFNPYKFYAYLNSNQAVSASTFTKVALDTNAFDTGGNFDAVTNHRFVAPVAGFYVFNGRVGIQSVSSRVIASLYKNGTEVLRGYDGQATTGAVGGGQVGGLIQLAATDYIELYAFTTGTALQSKTNDAQATACSLTGFLMSAI